MTSKSILALCILILLTGALTGCKSSSSAQYISCPGIYELSGAVGAPVQNDEQAFTILKEGNTYNNQNGTMWVEDKLPEDMTYSEALDRNLFRRDLDIVLTDGTEISGVWMLFRLDEALDTNGNIYTCRYDLYP
ncbi:MAG: hypothetical protein ABIA93_02610 [Candidatus Woesearchaeota archaeon]